MTLRAKTTRASPVAVNGLEKETSLVAGAADTKLRWRKHLGLEGRTVKCITKFLHLVFLLVQTLGLKLALGRKL